MRARAHLTIPCPRGLVLSPRAAENPGGRAGSQAGRGGSCLPPAPTPSLLTRLPPSHLLQNEITHDELCAACKRGANLQPCGTCPGAYHLSCLDPPLKTVPKGVWVCPRCQQKVWEAVSVCGRPDPHPLPELQGPPSPGTSSEAAQTIPASWIIPTVSRDGEGQAGEG